MLIGGTAATLAMDSAGLEFRATKDLDIVLHIEALNPTFGSEGAAAVPNWRLHPLQGGQKGRWAVWLDENWRLTFAFEGKDAVLVDYEDYH